MYLETQQHLQNRPGKSNIHRTYTAVPFFLSGAPLKMYSLGGYIKAFPTVWQKRCIRCTIIQFSCSICFGGAEHCAGSQNVPCQLHIVYTPWKFTAVVLKWKCNLCWGSFEPPCHASIALLLTNCFTSIRPLEGSAALSRTLLQDYSDDPIEANSSAQIICFSALLHIFPL